MSEVQYDARSGGWIYFDQHGKDYGPYDTADEAHERGREAAQREEKLMRRG